MRTISRKEFLKVGAALPLALNSLSLLAAAKKKLPPKLGIQKAGIPAGKIGTRYHKRSTKVAQQNLSDRYGVTTYNIDGTVSNMSKRFRLVNILKYNYNLANKWEFLSDSEFMKYLDKPILPALTFLNNFKKKNPDVWNRTPYINAISKP